MNNSSIAEQEDLIKDSLFALVKNHIPTAQVSDIDEIVLTYVVSILEDLGTEVDVEDAFDVEGFCEMLSAYLPDFVNIDHGSVCDWIFQLSSTLSQKKFKESDKEIADISLNRLNLSGSLSSSGRSRHSSSECSNSEYNIDLKKRNHLLSEASDASSDSSCDFSGQEDSFLRSEVQMLQEMFPRSSLMEVRHCLAVADGDVERAAQIVLHRQEAGQSISHSVNLLQPISQRQRPTVNDEELKSRIIARYSYVDKNDEVREHRPVAPKSEPKKLVRYRDNKIVSLKGERFTEVKKDDGEEQSHKIFKQGKMKGH
ncbi:conserved hypothetical protein [Pediculus humanus corporis]|uniref:CUE domain-containing protein n=1 Tax=Pediculus humanus subsp. corporis TaxID=121224 RepID=E0VSV3_PEDHC|nr:uncharacterized protein Phum_PHUM423620 [Pediculus humanus corporis]EEB16459.1 conserved hypothetical protein [Pediculus humanus corporis]